MSTRLTILHEGGVSVWADMLDEDRVYVEFVETPGVRFEASERGILLDLPLVVWRRITDEAVREAVERVLDACRRAGPVESFEEIQAIEEKRR